MAPTVTQTLNLARSQLGVREQPRDSNRTPFGAWYGMNGVAWCDIFVSWVFLHLPGGSALVGGKHASTVAHAQWFQARRQWGHDARPGAVVFFNFPGDGVNRIQHVGIVESVRSGGHIVTIEGNTGAGSGGNQSNGDGVYRRVRSTGAVVGYGYPAYARSGTVAVLPDPARRDPLLLVDGVWGPITTAALQRMLKLPARGVIDVPTRKEVQRWVQVERDGQWGPITRKALQRTVGVDQDGEWGSVTVKALQRHLNQ